MWHCVKSSKRGSSEQCVIAVAHIPRRERKRALRDVYAVEPVAPKFNPSGLSLAVPFVGLLSLAGLGAAESNVNGGVIGVVNNLENQPENSGLGS